MPDALDRLRAQVRHVDAEASDRAAARSSRSWTAAARGYGNVTQTKICGITNLDDALSAARLGAHAIGFVFAESKRRIDPAHARHIATALPARVAAVGVFVDAPLGDVLSLAEHVRLDAVQLHGDEPPEYCRALNGVRVIKRFNVTAEDDPGSLRARMSEYEVDGYLLDPGAGGGQAFDWRKARGLGLPLIVSGGLNADNVADAIRMLRPFAVDVSSGVERSAGHKDARRMRAFIDAVRSCDVRRVT